MIEENKTKATCITLSLDRNILLKFQLKIDDRNDCPIDFQNDGDL